MAYPVKLEFSEAEVRLILTGLAKLPLEMSLNLFNRIGIEAQAQAANISEAEKA